MIDLHSHILPNIDDGSSSIFETYMMLKEAEKCGITEIFATPHYIEGTNEQDYEEILKQVEEINKAAKEQNINVKLYPAEEIYLIPELLNLISNKKVLTLNLSKYFLIEFPIRTKPQFISNMIFELCSSGYVPVIAHPERYSYVKENLEIVQEWKKSGALLQCNYGSLLGIYGKDAKKTIEKLLKKELVDFMGSDCHRAGAIYDDMEKVLKILKKNVKEDYFQALTSLNAKRIIANM